MELTVDATELGDLVESLIDEDLCLDSSDLHEFASNTYYTDTTRVVRRSEAKFQRRVK